MINRHVQLNFKRPVSVLSRPFQLSSGKRSSVVRSHEIPKSLNFVDPAVSFNTKSSFELLRSVAVFSICQIRPLIKRSDLLLKISYRILGQGITNYALKLSFFNHFCAGEDEVRIKPTIDYLHSNGIGSILDYAAEADIGSKETDTSKAEKRLETDCLQARVYDYEGENLCDLHAETFKKCILAVHKVSPTGTRAISTILNAVLFLSSCTRMTFSQPGFAAIKCTALGNPILLEGMSKAIVEWRAQFRKLDSEKKGNFLI
jgi:proline dehydrogenase